MIPWKLLDRARVPGSDSELTLHQRDAEFSIRVDGAELMNSRMYASEDALSVLGCKRVGQTPRPRVLIGGLGMGYSLRTALSALGPDAEIVIAELVPAVVGWNRGPLGHLAEHPLADPRVRVREEDVGAVMRSAPDTYHAILLDVDNGPEGLTRKKNDWLYGRDGLLAARRALRADGVLGIWSASPDQAFCQRFKRAGYDVEQVMVHSRSKGKGSRHTIWLGKRGT